MLTWLGVWTLWLRVVHFSALSGTVWVTSCESKIVYNLAKSKECSMHPCEVSVHAIIPA